MHQNYLADESLAPLLEKVDSDLAKTIQAAGCRRCGAKLHRDNYPRKPRGGPEHWDWRHSFTCVLSRHRNTPASVRFLGPKVYVGVVIILVSALRHGLSPQTAKCLKQHLQVDRRTLNHWRQWWLERFAQGGFWKMARAEFMPLICEQTLPAGLCERFEVQRRDRLLKLLKFLAPITTGCCLVFTDSEGGD